VTSTRERSRQVHIERLCREGNRHASAREYSEALACFIEAFELLPEPPEAQPEAAPVMAGLNRLLRERRDLAPGLEALLTGRCQLGATRARGDAGGG
jgi:hypothetical protein